MFLQESTKIIAGKQESRHGPVAEKPLALFSEKTPDDGNWMIALRQNVSAGDQTSSPLILFRTALAAVSGNVFLRDTKNDRANSRPHARAGAHGAGFVRGIEDEVEQVASIAARYILECFQFDVLDA